MRSSKEPWWQDQVIPVLLNRNSGAIVGGPPEKIAQLVETEATRLGLTIRLQLLSSSDIDAAIEQAVKSGARTLIIGGGDGTILSAARHLIDSDCVLVPLPFGTLNLLARDLAYPLDPAEAIRSLASAEFTRIDAAEVNGTFFLCVAVLGFYPALAWEAKTEYHGKWWRKILWSVQQLAASYFKYPALRVEIQAPGTRRTLLTRTIAIFNNPFAEQLGLVPQRANLQRGKLGIYLSRHKTWFSIFRGLAAFVLGRHKADQDLEILETSAFTLTTRRRKKLRASLDGELFQFAVPLRFRIHPGALQVLAIPKREGETPSEP